MYQQAGWHLDKRYVTTRWPRANPKLMRTIASVPKQISGEGSRKNGRSEYEVGR